MKMALSLGGFLLMAACATVPPAAPVEAVPVMGEGACNATKAQGLVGRAANNEQGAEALRLTGATALRWIRPGDAVTMDYRTDRLNIELDSANRIVRVACG